MPPDTPVTTAVPSLNQDFATILIFLVFGAVFVVLNMVAIGRLIRSKTKYNEVKAAAYECGEPAFGSGFVRFDIRFYVLALVFAIFDVEVVFLFPWGAVLKDLGWLGLVEGAVFVAVLSLGLAYVWRKGDIDWIPVHGHKRGGARAAAAGVGATGVAGPGALPAAAPAGAPVR